MERPLALVVDSDPAVRSLVREVLEEQGVTTLGARTATEALEVLRTRPLRILVVDLASPGVEATDLVGTARRLRPGAALVVLGNEENGERAVTALGSGASDVLLKPFDDMQLRLLAARAVRHGDLLEQRDRLREQLRAEAGFDRMVGRSRSMELMRERLRRVASGSAHVLFVGERGVGKQLAARTLHAMSEQRDATFQRIECSAVSEQRLEEELGPGRAAEAGPRVLFLDGLTALAPGLQDRMAEALQASSTARWLSDRPRVLSSTRGDPGQAAADGRLRDDLLRVLASATIEVPPLRERVEDIALLVQHFIDSIREINELPPVRLSPEALAVLERHRWPGNVRELRAAVEQAMILAADGTIRPRDLPGTLREAVGGAAVELPSPADRVFKEAKRGVVESFERRYLRDILERHGGNVTAAAQQAGMLRSALQRLLRKHNIRSADFRRRSRAEA